MSRSFNDAMPNKLMKVFCDENPSRPPSLPFKKTQ